jgi:hypothetical protein
MSVRSALAPRDPGGTRFLLYPQPPFLPGFEDGERVWVSPAPGTVQPGPSDDRMYAVYPLDKLHTYGTPLGPDGGKYAPPWRGPAYPPAMPDADGHFDHIEPGTPEFEQAHLYGAARFVLDIWEGYFGEPINWHFGGLYDRMELVIMPRFRNATMGYGFLEIGGYQLTDGAYWPFSLNFDVIGHEIGHSIIYPIVGLPNPEILHNDYYGFHESAADLVGLIASLHFDTVIGQLMAQTRGNLYALNELNRFGELTGHHQIRIASNTASLADFVDGWSDEHDLGQPLTGAVFDTLVDIFHELLVERGVISVDMEDLSDALEEDPDYEPVMQAIFDEAYAREPVAMTQTLVDARDHVGLYLAAAFRMLTPDLRYVDVGNALLDADREVTGGRYVEIIYDNLERRGIFGIPVGPRIGEPDEHSHMFSDRTAVPARFHRRRRKLSYRDRYHLARR